MLKHHLTTKDGRKPIRQLVITLENKNKHAVCFQTVETPFIVYRCSQCWNNNRSKTYSCPSI